MGSDIGVEHSGEESGIHKLWHTHPQCMFLSVCLSAAGMLGMPNIPRPSALAVFEDLQYAKTEGEGLPPPFLQHCKQSKFGGAEYLVTRIRFLLSNPCFLHLCHYGKAITNRGPIWS